jgi:hypothetical protein
VHALVELIHSAGGSMLLRELDAAYFARFGHALTETRVIYVSILIQKN